MQNIDELQNALMQINDQLHKAYTEKRYIDMLDLESQEKEIKQKLSQAKSNLKKNKRISSDCRPTADSISAN